MYPWTNEEDEDGLRQLRADPPPYAIPSDVPDYPHPDSHDALMQLAAIPTPPAAANGGLDAPDDLGTEVVTQPPGGPGSAQAPQFDDTVSSLATPSADFQNPGPSPMWEAYSNQRMHMLPDSGPDDAVSQTGSRSSGSDDSGDGWRTAGLVGAGLLDVLLNRGRHAGALLGTAIQAGDPYTQQSRDLDLQYKQAQINHLNRAGFGRGADPMVLALRQQALELQKQRLGIQGDAEQRKYKEWFEHNSPDSDAAKRAYDIAVHGGLDPKVAQGKSEADLAKLSPAVNEYLKSTGAIGAARTEQAANTAGAQAEAVIAPHVEQALKTEQALQPYELEKIAAGTKAKIEGERDARNQPIPGFIVVDDNAFRSASGDEVTRRQMEQSAGAYRALMTSMDRLRELRAKYGAELPGEHQAEYEMAKTVAIGALTKLGETGVLNEGEYQRYSKSIPGIEPSLLDVPNVVGMDIKGDQLRGVQRALRGVVDAKLYQWGARYDYDSLKPAAPKPKRRASPGASAPTVGDDYDYKADL